MVQTAHPEESDVLRPGIHGIVILLLLAGASPARAVQLDGFEAQLPGTTPLGASGNVSVEAASSFTPAGITASEGAQFLFLTTGPGNTGAGSTGIDRNGDGANEFDPAAWVFSFEGSGTFSLEYNLLTSDAPGGAINPDLFEIVLDGAVLVRGVVLDALGNTWPVVGPFLPPLLLNGPASNHFSDGQLGWSTVSTVLAPGAHTLEVFVGDGLDALADTALLLDAIDLEFPSGPTAESCSVPDLDGDGTINTIDSCPTIPNPGEQGLGPGVRGAACNQPALDLDADGVADAFDNCPLVQNALQEDSVTIPGEWIALGDACCLPVIQAVGQLCIAGLATGASFSWAIDDDGTAGPQLTDSHDLTAAVGAAGSPPAAIAQQLAASIDAEGTYDASATANCVDDGSGGSDFWVGASGSLPDCEVGGPPGCSFNPTIVRVAAPAAVPSLAATALATLGCSLLAAGILTLVRPGRSG